MFKPVWQNNESMNMTNPRSWWAEVIVRLPNFEWKLQDYHNKFYPSACSFRFRFPISLSNHWVAQHIRKPNDCFTSQNCKFLDQAARENNYMRSRIRSFINHEWWITSKQELMKYLGMMKYSVTSGRWVSPIMLCSTSCSDASSFSKEYWWNIGHQV